MNLPSRQPRCLRAFTLIEALLALAISAVVLVAINTVFFSAMHLRSTVVDRAKETLPLEQAVTTIKRDLLGIVPPNTNGMAGAMGTDVTVNGMSQPPILEIFTTTGTLGDELPWGDLQKIDYSLQASSNRGAAGRDLMRGVTRNLLAGSTPATPEQHLVIGGVQNFRFSFFDGTNWNDVWSSTLSNVPIAMKVFLTFAAPRNGAPANPPVQFVVPIVTQPPTNVVDTNASTVGN